MINLLQAEGDIVTNHECLLMSQFFSNEQQHNLPNNRDYV